MKTTWKLGLSLVLASAAGNASALTPPWVEIEGITYAGSGCPAGTVGKQVAPDLRAFTLLFSDYVAEAGPWVPFRESRKNCQINVDLRFPQGWSYSIVTVDYRGYVSLDRGVSALQKSTYYFQGQRHQASFASPMYGPVDRDYRARDRLGLDAVVWSPCGLTRSLNMNTQVRVNNRRNRRGSGIITLDSIDGQIEHIYGIQWRRCR